MKNILNFFSLLLCFIALALASCDSRPQYSNQPQQYPQNQPQTQSNNSDVESENGQYDNRAGYQNQGYQQNQPQPQYQEDHSTRNAIIGAGIGYIAGRAHANYNQKKESQKQTNNNTILYNRSNTSSYSQPSRPQGSTRTGLFSSPSRPSFSSPTRRSTFGSFGSRSQRRR
jgi:hypothetical protein